jgi:hypothetical protein
MPATPEQIVKDIEELQGILTTIEADLEEMKRRMRAGPKKIPDPELDITVKDIDRLKDLMYAKRENGH